MYASEFEMNYANASLSEVSASLSETIRCERSTILRRDEGSSELRDCF
jgi:hypothetical protein